MGAKVSKKSKKVEQSVEELRHLEQISENYEKAELAWQRMTSPPEGDETWAHLEEHLLARDASDQDRTWKFFAK
jgi:hypothetical protein